MPNPWYPGATRDPGVSAGYAHGQVVSVLSCVTHYTVGTDSRGLIRDQGLCEFLVSRDGTVWQFCEADAICYQAGYPYNGRGPGIEVEYLPGQDTVMFTQAALSATGSLVRWLNIEWGIPLNYYDAPDGPRIADHVGFISHRSVIEDSDYHTDYWERSDWDQMVAGSSISPEEDILYVMRCEETAQDLVVTEFRVAGYTINSVTGPVMIVPVSKAEAAAEIQARKDLAAQRAGTTGGAGSLVVDYDKLGAAITAGIKNL